MLEAPMAPVVSPFARNIATTENAWNPTFVNASPDMVGPLAQNVSQYSTFLRLRAASCGQPFFLQFSQLVKSFVAQDPCHCFSSLNNSL